TVWGQNLGAKGELTIGGKPVTPVKTWTPTRIEFVVPKDAPTGSVALFALTELGDKVEAKFDVVLPPPVITSIAPEPAKVGDWVVIKGHDFGDKQPESLVKFF